MLTPAIARPLLASVGAGSLALALGLGGLDHDPPVALGLAQAPSVVADPADCTASSDGTARYFVSVRSTSGVDITHAVGRLFGIGSENAGQHVNMSNGDFEAQADDGSRPSCVPRPPDGRANDLGSTFVPAVAGTHTWTLQVLVAGYAPAAPIDLSPYVDGTVCPLGDGAGCLISLGTILMAGVALPSSSGGATTAPTRGATPNAVPPVAPLVLPAPPAAAPITSATRMPPATPSPTTEPPSIATATPIPTGTIVPPMAPIPADSPIPAPIEPVPVPGAEPSGAPVVELAPTLMEEEPEPVPGEGATEGPSLSEE